MLFKRLEISTFQPLMQSTYYKFSFLRSFYQKPLARLLFYCCGPNVPQLANHIISYFNAHTKDCQPSFNLRKDLVWQVLKTCKYYLRKEILDFLSIISPYNYNIKRRLTKVQKNTIFLYNLHILIVYLLNFQSHLFLLVLNRNIYIIAHQSTLVCMWA